MKARLPLARRFVTSSDCCCNTGLRIAELSTETVVYCCLNTESWSQSFQCNTNLSCAELMDSYHILLWAQNINFENKCFALMWKWMNQSEHNFARANFWPDWPIRIKIRAKRTFTRFELWVIKPFVKRAPENRSIYTGFQLPMSSQF